MRRIILVAMIVFGLAVLFLTFTKRSENQLEVKTYFQDAVDLERELPFEWLELKWAGSQTCVFVPN